MKPNIGDIIKFSKWDYFLVVDVLQDDYESRVLYNMTQGWYETISVRQLSKPEWSAVT